VRRNGKLIVGDIQAQIDTVRTAAQHEGLSQTCLDRIEKAERMAPTMQATIEFVSGYVRRQVSQLDLAPPASYAMHAFLIPSFYLEHVAHTRTVSGGEPLRELATRLRTSLFEPGRVFAELSPTAQTAQATDQNAGGGVPAFKLQCRRAQRVSFVEEPSTTRARAPQKACMSDSGAQLLSHTGRRDDHGGAVFRAEIALDVCRNFSVRRHTASAPQSATTRCRIARRVQGGRCHDRGPF